MLMLFSFFEMMSDIREPNECEENVVAAIVNRCSRQEVSRKLESLQNAVRNTQTSTEIKDTYEATEIALWGVAWLNICFVQKRMPLNVVAEKGARSRAEEKE